MKVSGRTGGLVAALLSVAALVATAGTSASAADGVSQPMVWGATVKNVGTQTMTARVAQFEASVARPIAATRDFLSWDSPFPAAYETAMRNSGHSLLVSVRTRTVSGALIPWATIAAAAPGSDLYLQMQSWADRVRDFGAPIYITLQHEPETVANNVLGSQADYIAAWQKWVQIMRDEGATNAKQIWITTAFGYSVKTTDRRFAPHWYPGDDWVDAIGTDAYNWFTCRTSPKSPWTSLATLIEPMRQFALLHPTKEAWVTEFGSVEDPATSGRRAQWITDAQAMFQQVGYEQFRGVLYFDLNKAPCDWRVDPSPTSLAALTAMGADPFFSG